MSKNTIEINQYKLSPANMSVWGEIYGAIQDQKDLINLLDSYLGRANWGQIEGNINEQEDLINLLSQYVDRQTIEQAFATYDAGIKAWVEAKGYLTQHQDISGKADVSYVDAQISDVESQIPSLEGYATETYVDTKISEVESEIPSLEGLASVSYVDTKISDVESQIPSLEGYATETWVEGQGYLTEHQTLKTINGESVVGTGDIEVGGLTPEQEESIEILAPENKKKGFLYNDVVDNHLSDYNFIFSDGSITSINWDTSFKILNGDFYHFANNGQVYKFDDGIFNRVSTEYTQTVASNYFEDIDGNIYYNPTNTTQLYEVNPVDWSMTEISDSSVPYSSNDWYCPFITTDKAIYCINQNDSYIYKFNVQTKQFESTGMIFGNGSGSTDMVKFNDEYYWTSGGQMFYFNEDNNTFDDITSNPVFPLSFEVDGSIYYVEGRNIHYADGKYFYNRTGSSYIFVLQDNVWVKVELNVIKRKCYVYDDIIYLKNDIQDDTYYRYAFTKKTATKWSSIAEVGVLPSSGEKTLTGTTNVRGQLSFNQTYLHLSSWIISPENSATDVGIYLGNNSIKLNSDTDVNGALKIGGVDAAVKGDFFYNVNKLPYGNIFTPTPNAPYLDAGKYIWSTSNVTYYSENYTHYQYSPSMGWISISGWPVFEGENVVEYSGNYYVIANDENNNSVLYMLSSGFWEIVSNPLNNVTPEDLWVCEPLGYVGQLSYGSDYIIDTDEETGLLTLVDRGGQSVYRYNNESFNNTYRLQYPNGQSGTRWITGSEKQVLQYDSEAGFYWVPEYTNSIPSFTDFSRPVFIDNAFYGIAFYNGYKIFRHSLDGDPFTTPVVVANAPDNIYNTEGIGAVIGENQFKCMYQTSRAGQYGFLFGLGVAVAEYEGGLVPGNKYSLIQDVDASGNKTYKYEKKGVGQSEGAGAGEIFNIYTGITKNVASGQYSHAEGYRTQATAQYTHAEGTQSKATGENAHAEGSKTTASGRGSHAEGYYCVAGADNTHAEGNSCETTVVGGHAEGVCNVDAPTFQHTVGIGTNYQNRKNAHTITTTGEHYILGVGGYLGTETDLTNVQDVATVINNKLEETSLKTINQQSIVGTGDITISGGGVGQTESSGGEIFNSYEGNFKNKAQYEFDHAEGYGTTANGNTPNTPKGGAHAEGCYSQATNAGAHAEGLQSTANGSGAHAEGRMTQALGSSTHAEGQGCQTYDNTRVGALSIGYHAEGSYNVYDNSTFQHTVGIGTSSSARKNAHTITTTGEHYILGVGGYQGTETDVTNVQDVATVINNKLDIPSLPSADGNYVLKCTITDGVPTYSWVSE